MSWGKVGDGYLYNSETFEAGMARIGETVAPLASEAAKSDFEYADLIFSRNVEFEENGERLGGLLLRLNALTEPRERILSIIITDDQTWGLDHDQRTLVGRFSLEYGRRFNLPMISLEGILPMPHPELVIAQETSDLVAA